MDYNKKIMFSAAVRDFHFYRRAWLPTESEKRKCAHDKNNPFDDFAIKTVVAMLLGICQWNFCESQSSSLIEGQKWRHNYHQQTIVGGY